MPSDRTTEKMPEHDALWELIPWYVNGSLSKAESDQVEAFANASPEFAAEIEHQSALAVSVYELDVNVSPDAGAQSLARLKAQIAGEQNALKPQREARAWWSAWLSGAQGGMALAGIAAVAIVVGVLATGPGTQTDEGFVTLTSEATTDQPTIKFQSADGINTDNLVRILAEHGMVLIEEQSSTGVLRAAAPEGTDLTAAAEKLMADPAIAFAAPE